VREDETSALYDDYREALEVSACGMYTIVNNLDDQKVVQLFFSPFAQRHQRCGLWTDGRASTWFDIQFHVVLKRAMFRAGVHADFLLSIFLQAST
jgi:hypothetical protein